MNSFVLSPSAMGAGTALSYLPIIEKYHVAIINREDSVFEKIQKGDLVIIARGANWQKEVYFAGIVSSEAHSFSQEGVEGDYTLDLVDFVDLRNGPNIPFNTQCTYGGSKNPGAVYQLQTTNGYDCAVINAVLSAINQENRKMFIDDLKQLLEKSLNLILTGAPGTGKTYLAREIAKALTGDTDGKRWEFVQFHPSYDYTDFVEGLRPTPPDTNGNVGFKLTEGTFKEFCRKAINGTLDDGQDNFEEVWQKLVDELNENDFLKVTNLSGKGEFEIELNEYGTGLASRTYASDEAKNDHNWVDGHSKFFSKEQLRNVYQGLPGVPGGGHDNYRKAVINMMKKELGLVDYKAGVQNAGEKSKYVFIIDEINRGDIAKIFGELFFALDPGYRGEKGRVKTQYTNLIDDNDRFKAGFYIPDNVYIIGTMNDIDRNVESMDFAIRRRFTWMEIKPEDNLGMWDDPQNGIADYKENALKYMKAVNKTITDISSLGPAYQLGASYFMKLREYEGNFDTLWNYHIQPLLNEYLRGLPNANAEMSKLTKAWKNALRDSNPTEAEVAPTGNDIQA